MPITFSCPACNKPHTVRDELAGKSARCGCGSQVRIPNASSAAASPPAPVSMLGAPPPATSPQSAQGFHGQGNPATRSFAPVVSSSASVANAWTAQQSVPRRKPQKKEVLRYVVAGGAIFYSLFNPVLAFLMFWVTGLPTPPVIFAYTPVILVGAVLIIIKNRWGPSVTALAMLFGGFMQGWAMVGVGIASLLETGSGGGLIVGTFLMYIIPAAIFVWCVFEEKRRPVSP